ncbi:winged helix-turn-helix domain-containing protein [Halobacterium zhouii]|uniref:winged helix-turn-helix domain-containing protein n=1 Tax=Halobacterium zhouii TaxID=2902624 RepID=UPI001E584CE4|nr:winged helix-turn-helix domain-containing protein [Halobacterium zhouii]
MNQGRLPHVTEWDDVLDHLRDVVATHAHWAGVERADLVADDFFEGPGADAYEYERPTGRRKMLRQEYEDRATDVYREALKESTTAVYDLLDVVAQEHGATYDLLERKTGLARSTVRYHVARLADAGVLERIGNPVLVVYDSEALHDKARDVLRKVNPDDTPEDRDERADERRERRERDRQADADPDAADDDAAAQDADDDAAAQDADDDAAAQDADERSTWRYLDDWSGTPQMLIDEIVRDERTERDVRVRVLEDADDGPPPT